VRPFVVTVGSDRVTALGTLFQVDRSPSELVVTLAQGSVSVTNESNAEAIRLSPGEELRLSASGTRWSTRNVDTQSATSWAQF
jgi:transmembrane sensor